MKLQLLSSAVGRYGTESVRKWHVATLAICQLSRLVLTLHRVGPLAQETSMKMTRRKLLI